MIVEAFIKYTFMQNAVFAAILASITAGIIGVIAMEKKLISMSGGIAHASFGGIGLGYLLGFEPILGGLLFAVGSSTLISKLSKDGRIKADSLTGILWSFGMALGILFISLAPGYMPDMTSYLFGDILSVSSQAFYYMLGFTALVILLFISFFQHFVIYLFDEDYAVTQGINTRALGMMIYIIIPVGIIVMTKVVGIILTIALMTIPVSIAKLIFKSIPKVIVASMAISMLLCLLGITLSYYLQIPSGSSIVILSSLIYFIIGFMQRGVEKLLHNKRKHS